MKKLVCSMIFILLSQSAFAGIVVSLDSENNCQIHRATSPEMPSRPEENSIDGRESYGFTLKNLVVDFDQEVVYVDVINRIVFGFDRVLTGKPVMIKASNPEFQKLINHLNFSIQVFDQVCLTESNELIYAIPIRNQEK